MLADRDRQSTQKCGIVRAVVTAVQRNVCKPYLDRFGLVGASEPGHRSTREMCTIGVTVCPPIDRRFAGRYLASVWRFCVVVQMRCLYTGVEQCLSE